MWTFSTLSLYICLVAYNKFKWFDEPWCLLSVMNVLWVYAPTGVTSFRTDDQPGFLVTNPCHLRVQTTSTLSHSSRLMTSVVENINFKKIKFTFIKYRNTYVYIIHIIVNTFKLNLNILNTIFLSFILYMFNTIWL